MRYARIGNYLGSTKNQKTVESITRMGGSDYVQGIFNICARKWLVTADESAVRSVLFPSYDRRPGGDTCRGFLGTMDQTDSTGVWLQRGESPPPEER